MHNILSGVCIKRRVYAEIDTVGIYSSFKSEYRTPSFDLEQLTYLFIGSHGPYFLFAFGYGDLIILAKNIIQ